MTMAVMMMMDRVTCSRSFLFDGWKEKKKKKWWQISTRERYLREKVIWFHVNRPPYVPLLFSFKPGTPSTKPAVSALLYLSFLWIMHRLNLSVITRGKRAPRNRAPLDYWRRKEEHHSPLRHDIKRDSGRSIFRSIPLANANYWKDGRKTSVKIKPGPRPTCYSPSYSRTTQPGGLYLKRSSSIVYSMRASWLG